MKKTKASKFGTSKRESHDSSGFYSRKMYMNAARKEESISYNTPDKVNVVHCASSRDMRELPDNSIHLMVTSPPYNVGKEYDKDYSLNEYLGLLLDVFSETYRVLINGGRACINVANIGRKPYIPLNSHISDLMNRIGFNMRGEIIWNKSASVGSSTAWGSWQSASNPTLRDVHEYILIFSKGTYSRKGGKSRITKEEFLEFTKSIWNFPAVSAKKIGHPSPFPLELPTRLIKLYSFEGDIVLDPFLGSGQTAIAALNLNCKYIGYDISVEYSKLAEKRIEAARYLSLKSQSGLVKPED
jgi:site-specific DNA-methyltransferase (adenine-specific)